MNDSEPTAQIADWVCTANHDPYPSWVHGGQQCAGPIECDTRSSLDRGPHGATNHSAEGDTPDTPPDETF